MDIASTLAQDVIRECRQKGFVVAPQLAAFYLRILLVADEKEGGAVEISQQRAKLLTKAAVEALTRSDSANVETFKMQAAVAAQRQDIVNVQRTELVHHRAKAQQLLVEVCDRNGSPAKIFGDMVLYVLHETGLYNASNKEVVQKETLTALESVIPRTSVQAFIAQTDAEKVKQLDELWKIVWGIRLFNRETNKGGAGITDVPGDLAALLQGAQSALRQQLDQATALCDQYLACFLTEVVPEADLARLAEEYINRQQYRQFLARLAESVGAVAAGVAAVQPAYAALVEEVRGMVTSAVSVPKSTIYPRFIDIGERWERYKVLLAEMKGHKRVLDALLAFQHSYTQRLKPSLVEQAMHAQARTERPIVDQVALQQSINQAGYANTCVYTPVLPADTMLQFNGFCVVSIIHNQVLRPSAADVGYLGLNGKYYGFADEKALRAFAQHPQPFLHATARNATMAKMALVTLLGLEGELPAEVYYEGSRPKALAGPVVRRQDADTQTGQIDPYKDYKYQWNEWELRRLALKLADLRNKRTHSCQTHESHFKRDNDTQTYPKKQQGSQTLVDQATQPRHTARYIGGLRGDPESRLKVVAVEFDE